MTGVRLTARLELRYPRLCDRHRRPQSFGEEAHFYCWWRRAVIYRRLMR